MTVGFGFAYTHGYYPAWLTPLEHNFRQIYLNVQSSVSSFQLEGVYRGVVIREPLILDILVEDKVIIEVKAVEKGVEIYKPQLLTYLRLSGMKLGLLINFGQNSVKEGIHRVVNGL